MRRHEGDGARPGARRSASARSPRWRRAPRPRPAASPEAIKARLAEQIATLLDASERFDPDRLHQEAILIASKADIREELDRLAVACRAGAAADRRRRRGRPPARFPVAGAQPRSQHALRQVERRGADQYRARAQEPWSSSSASRCRTWNRRAWRAIAGDRQRQEPRAHAISARRGLMLVLSSPSGAGKTTLSRMLLDADPIGRAVGLGDDAARAAPTRSTARDYHFIDRARSTRMVRERRAARMGRGVRQLLRHAARAGRGGARGRARRAVRHRLAGHAAVAREGARRHGEHLRAAAVDRRARAAPAHARARRRARDQAAAWRRPATR